MGSLITEILKEMCRRVGADFEKMDFKKNEWFYQYSWTVSAEEDFKDWMFSRLNNATMYELKQIAEYPGLVKRSNKLKRKLINEFIMQYGWRLE